MDDSDRLRLVFWNTFLLSPHPIPGGPALPEVGDLAAPAVADRSVAIGRALAARFDVAAMAEAFEPEDRDRVVAAWGSDALTTAVGPGRSILRGPLGFASSGLFTVVNGRRVVRKATHQFSTRGSYLHDADALANKGVLLVEVDLGTDRGNLELYSTHLCWGTGLLGGAKATDPLRRHATRMAQVDELVGFVQRTHRPENVVVVVGDMNVPAVDENFPHGSTGQYDDLTERLGVLDVRDVWSTNGQGPGDTCGAPTDEFADQRDPEDLDALIDSVTPDITGVDSEHLAERERIDYVFIQGSDARHRVKIEVSGVRRYAFPRLPDAPKRERLVRLSDHLAVGVDLAIAAR